MAALGLLPLLALLGAGAPMPGPHAPAMLPFVPRQVVEKARFAFHRDGDGYSGGHRTYQARHDDGRLTLTPLAYHVAPSEPRQGGLTLGAPVILRGPRAVRLAAPQVAVAADGSLRLQRGTVEERFQNSAAGLTQFLRFPALPAGRGPLVVRIPVRGLAYQAATRTGLHFSDERRGASLRYGLGRWVDADGKHLHVAPSFQNGAIVLSIPEDTLRETTFPAVLAPVLSPEFGIDQPVASVEPAAPDGPTLGTDGTNFLVAWSQPRIGGAAFVATRVSPRGEVLDGGGLKVPAPANGDACAVGHGGGHYVLACPRGLVRISDEGVLLDPQPLPFPGAARAGGAAPAIAFNGTHFLLTWTAPGEGADSAGALFGLLFSPSGAVVMGPKLLSEDYDSALASSVVAVGTSFRVAYSQKDSTTRALSLDAQGHLVSPPAPDVSGAPSPGDFTDEGGADERVVLHAPGALLRGSRERTEPSVSNLSDLYGARLGTRGEVLDASGTAIASVVVDAASSTVAWSRSTWLVAWVEHTTHSGPVVRARRVSASGEWMDTVPLTLGSADDGPSASDTDAVWAGGAEPPLTVSFRGLHGSDNGAEGCGCGVASGGGAPWLLLVLLATPCYRRWRRMNSQARR